MKRRTPSRKVYRRLQWLTPSTSSSSTHGETYACAGRLLRPPCSSFSAPPRRSFLFNDKSRQQTCSDGKPKRPESLHSKSKEKPKQRRETQRRKRHWLEQAPHERWKKRRRRGKKPSRRRSRLP